MNGHTLAGFACGVLSGLAGTVALLVWTGRRQPPDDPAEPDLHLSYC